jgi:putative redox protein
MAVEIDVNYAGNLHCNAVHGPSQQTLTTDAPVDNGGQGATFSPTDLVATSLGACLLTIMGLVARRHGWNLEGAQVHVTKEMTAQPVRRIGALKAHIRMPASAPSNPSDRSLIEAAARACPVKQSLHPDTIVQMDFEYPSPNAAKT